MDPQIRKTLRSSGRAPCRVPCREFPQRLLPETFGNTLFEELMEYIHVDDDPLLRLTGFKTKTFIETDRITELMGDISDRTIHRAKPFQDSMDVISNA